MFQLFKKTQQKTEERKLAERYPAEEVTYKNTHFKSKMEKNVYCFLSWLIEKYPDSFYSVRYEPERFHFKKNKWGCTSYVPDFKFNTACGMYYFEVKGFWEQRDGVKISLMKRDYPWLKMYYVDSKNYKKMKELYAKKVPGWE